MILPIVLLLLQAYPPGNVGLPAGGTTYPHEEVGGTPPTPPTIWEQATAFWTFNDPNGLGLEGDDVLVGNSTDFELADSDYTTGGDILDTADGYSFGSTAWVAKESNSTTHVWMSKATSLVTHGEFYFATNNSGQVFCRFRDGTSLKSATAGVTTVGVRAMVHCRYNAQTNELQAGLNGVWGTATSTASDGADTASPFNLSGYNNGFSEFDGLLASVTYYGSGSENALTDAITTSVYNLGKGKLCDSLSGDELTNLISCWNMSEASGGPYLDSVASNDLTASGTPIQAAGLVIEGDGDPDLYLAEVNVPTATGGALGYAADFEFDSFQNASSTPGWDIGDEDYLICAWGAMESTGNRVLVTEDDGGSNRNFLLYVATNTVTSFVWNGAGSARTATIAGAVAGQRQLFCIEHDAAGDLVYAWLDGTQSTGATTLGGHQTDVVPSKFGSQQGTNNWDGSFGPVYLWRGSYATADVATVFNSGKGLTCTDAIAGVSVAMDNCYDMDENGGPYLDSVGSTDFTAINTPARVAGLVERSDSGMSISMPGSALVRAADADWNYPGTESFSIAVWINRDTPVPSNYLYMVAKGVGWEYNIQSGYGTLTTSCAFIDSVPTTHSVSYDNHVAHDWELHVCVLDRSDNKVKASLNGAAYSVGATTVGATIRDSTQFFGLTDGDSDYRADNLAIWKGYALTQDDVDDLWAAGVGAFP